MKIQRSLSVFGLLELNFLIVILSFSFVLIAQFFPVFYYLLAPLLGYNILTIFHVWRCKAAARRQGLQHYYLVPVATPLARLVLRKKYALPKNAIIFAIHVQDRNKSVYASVDTRSLLTRINRDLQAGLEGLKELNEKTNQPVILIGSTFVAIGSRTKRILREKADFTELDSALLAFSSKLISFFNQDYFKRKAAVDREANLCWKTYIIHFHLPSLNN